MADLRRRLAHGGFWAAAETWGQQLVNFLIFAVLARLLGPEAYGLLALAIVIPALGELILMRGGWGEALIQRRALEPAHVDSVFWLLLVLSSLIGALTALGARPLALAFGVPGLEPLIPWLALTIPLAALYAVPDALMRRELRFAPLAARTLLATTLGGAAGIGAAFLGYGVWSLVVQQVVQRAVATAALWLACPWRPTLRFSRRHYGELHRFSVASLGERLLLYADEFVPRLLLGHYLGPVVLGYYVLARKLLELMTEALIQPFVKVAMPVFAQLQDDPVKARRILVDGTRLAAAIAFPAFAGLALVAPDLLPVAFGEPWRPAVPATQVLALVGLSLPLSYFAAALMRGRGRAGWQLLIGAVGTLLIVLGVALAGPYGLVPAALAILLRFALLVPLRLLVAGRVLGADVAAQARACLPFLGATGGMALAVGAWYALEPGLAPLPSLACVVALGGAAYPLAVAFLAPGFVRDLGGLVRATVGAARAGTP
ncbi:MAG: lipopolysaccharide biosynthesis protein [Geminicoccaceae bacterium]|nr:lipopolysaccharide biosynthesis protein [Geminicoccaceae bacterium]